MKQKDDVDLGGKLLAAASKLTIGFRWIVFEEFSQLSFDDIHEIKSISIRRIWIEQTSNCSKEKLFLRQNPG
jgi:hypothetical protein